MRNGGSGLGIVGKEVRTQVEELIKEKVQVQGFFRQLRIIQKDLKSQQGSKIDDTINEQRKDISKTDYRLIWIEKDPSNSNQFVRHKRSPLGERELKPQEYLKPGDETITFNNKQEAIEYTDFSLMEAVLLSEYDIVIQEGIDEVKKFNKDIADILAVKKGYSPSPNSDDPEWRTQQQKGAFRPEGSPQETAEDIYKGIRDAIQPERGKEWERKGPSILLNGK